MLDDYCVFNYFCQMKVPSLPTGIQNGDVVETKTTYPLINHFGVYIEIDGKPNLIHNTPKKGSAIDSWEKFFGDRKLLRVNKTRISGISTDDLMRKYLSKRKEYHLFFFDCEDFVEAITGEDYRVKQMEGAAILALGLLLGFFLLRGKK
jgi:hypothetical protein